MHGRDVQAGNKDGCVARAAALLTGHGMSCNSRAAWKEGMLVRARGNRVAAGAVGSLGQRWDSRTRGLACLACASFARPVLGLGAGLVLGLGHWLGLCSLNWANPIGFKMGQKLGIGP